MAAVVIRQGNRDGLERLCRYVLRPPLARTRLQRRGDGLLVLTLRKIEQAAHRAEDQQAVEHDVDILAHMELLSAELPNYELIVPLHRGAQGVVFEAVQRSSERLVVLHTLSDDQLENLFSKFDQSGLPNLWLPRKNAFYRIEEIPVLGTGKMDIKQVKESIYFFS